MEHTENKTLYSVAEAAKYLHMTPQGVHYLIKANKLKTVAINGKCYLIEKKELERQL